VTISKVMSAGTNHGMTSAKRNSGWKSTLTERDCHIFRTDSKTHRTTAAQVTAEVNIHLEDPASTKIVWCQLHKSNNHSWAAMAKSLFTESNDQMCKWWHHNHKTLTSNNKTTEMCDMVRWVVLHAVPYTRKS
jgi:hypothetical protein